MKKYTCNITFLIFIMIGAMTGAISCAPKSQDNVFTDLRKNQYEYQPRNTDREIVSTQSNNFKIQTVMGLERAQLSQTAWLSDSLEIFKLAENSIEMGDQVSNSERSQYKKFGHDLLRLFYQSKENSTQFDKNQSLFLPAALGFEGAKIKSLFTTIASTQNIEGAKKVFAGHKISWPEAQPTLKPAEFIRSIKSYLIATATLFEENGVSKEFVKTFSAQLEKDYLLALSQGEIKLKDTDQNQNLKISTNLISEVIQTFSFIPQEAIKPLLVNLVKAKKYAELIEPKHPSGVSQSGRMVQVITSIWLDLTPQQRESYIKPVNNMLYVKLSETSDKMLKWLAGRGELSLTDKEYYYSGFFKDGFIDRLGSTCHVDIQWNLNAWLSLNDSQKASLREKNPELFNIFSRYTPQEIKSEILVHFINGVFEKPFTNGGVVKKFTSELYPICISRIQLVLDKSVNLYLLSELDTQIRNWGSLIEKIVADKTMENLNGISTAIKSPEEFQAFFNKMATPVLNELVFNDSSLNGIENSQVQLFVDAKNQLKTSRSNLTEFDTGGELIGLSLAAQYRRIIELPEFENKAANSKEYYKIVFSQINKMISMIGFRTIDNRLISSLHRNFYGSIPDLDVYKYECSPKKVEIQRLKKEKYQQSIRDGAVPSRDNYVDKNEDCEGYENYHKNIFEIPDKMTINGYFAPGSYQKVSSVRSQSEIIRGSALMLQYFNDWRGPNDFDLGMGKEKYSEINLFPKSALVNLAVAAMTVSIRGLQKPNSPLKLFNIFGQEIPDWSETGIPDPETKGASLDPSKQIIQAAIVDLLSSGPSNVVKVEDMAYFMVAVDEFLKATEGIEKTRASVINPSDRVVKENLESILKCRRLLKMMMFAMSNFIVSRMQSEDGGFNSYYSLDTNQVIKKDEPRTLEVQLTVIDALLRVYGQWGGQGALVAAVESYYFMNQKLWNDETSFYRMNESRSNLELKPHLYLKAVKNFKTIEPYLNDFNSQAQAQRLFDYYSKEFLNWNQTSQPMSTHLQ